jgi:GNAT superfamily N-acetyltransferase
VLQIKTWLEEEEDAYLRGDGPQGFWCNVGIVETCHLEGDLLVARNKSGDTVGFAALGSNSIDILETRPDLRGTGCGKALASHAIHALSGRGANSVWVDCTPSSSLRFWKRQGFQTVPYREGRKCPAFLLISTHLDVPASAKKVSLEISAYAEGILHRLPVSALAQVEPDAYEAPKGSLFFRNRVVLDPEALGLRNGQDLVLTISYAGREIGPTKAKYDQMKALGVEQDRFGVFYIDQIKLPDPK